MLKKSFLLFFVLLSFCFYRTNERKALDYFELLRSEFKGDIAYQTTSFVAQFWRIAGNTGFNKTIYKIASELENVGFVQEKDAKKDDRFVYRIEKRSLQKPTWEPLDATLSIVGIDEPLLQFETNRNMVYINSSSTPVEGHIAEVIYLKDTKNLKDSNLKGKIVFAESSSGEIYEAAIIKGGALGIITYHNPDYIQPEKNSKSIQFRSLPYNKSVHAWGIALSFEAKEKLKSAISKGNNKVKVDISIKQYFSEELTIVANVLGSELPNESMVFSAHIQEPGANDNASGVGLQLEMAMLTAKLLAEDKIKAKRTITFLWGDEFVSTRRFIEDGEQTTKINWGISLDMVGENTDLTGGSFLIEKMPDPSAIWTRGKDKHSEWGSDPLTLEDMKPHYLNDFLIEIFDEQGQYANWEVNTNPFEGGSDHVPFIDSDIPSVLLWHFTDQFYHTDNDTMDKVSQETLKNVGIGTLTSAYSLINANYDTAIKLIETIKKAGANRIKEEFSLSQKAISNGSNSKNEIKILHTWEDWYVKALATIEELEPKSNKTLQTKIKKAQSHLEKLTTSFIQELE